MAEMPVLTLKAGYKSQAEDISPQADALSFWLLRQKTVQARLALGISLNRNARLFSLTSYKRTFPDLPLRELGRKMAIAWLQEDCPDGYYPEGGEMDWVEDSFTIAAQLHDILESLKIPYFITGDVAAIAYGETRTTRDLDIVISIP